MGKVCVSGQKIPITISATSSPASVNEFLVNIGGHLVCVHAVRYRAFFFAVAARVGTVVLFGARRWEPVNYRLYVGHESEIDGWNSQTSRM